MLDAALSLMNLRGRIVCCGNVSQYDVEKPAPGPMAVPGLVVTKRLRMEGFIVMDFYDRRAEAEARLARWVADGRIKAIVDVVDGLEKAPAGADRPVRRPQQSGKMARPASEASGPTNTGFRFSTNARTASLWSSVREACTSRSASR